VRARSWTLLAAAAVVAGAALTVPLRDLWEPDETTYAEVAREMLSTGQWLVPHLDGEAYSHKPPLYIWMVAALRGLGLPWTAAGVIPSLAALLAVLWVLPRLGRELGLDDDTGTLATVVFASAPLAAGMALGARMDMPLTLCFTGSLLYLARLLGVARPPDAARSAHLGLWLCIGFGVLFKGPLALALPLLAAAIFSLTSRPRVSLRPVLVGWGPLLAIAMVLAWLGPAVLSGGTAYLWDVVVRQSAGRMTRSFAHPQPFYYHLVTYPVTGLPWSFVTALAAFHALRRRRGGAAHFLAAAAVTVIAFFSLISGKLVVYLLPLFAPGALLAADALRRREPGTRAALALGAAAMAALSVALTQLARLRPEVPPLGAAGVAAAYALAALALLALGLAVVPRRTPAAIAALAACGLAWPAILLPLLLPRIGPFISVRPIAEAIRAAEPGESGGIAYGTGYAGFSLYAERVFRRVDDLEELRRLLGSGRVVTMYERHYLPLVETLAPLVAGVERHPFERGALVLLRGRAGARPSHPD